MQRLSMLAAAGNRNNVKKAEVEARPRIDEEKGEDEAAESAETEKRPDSSEAGKSSAEEGPSNNGPVAEEADQIEGLTPPCAHPPTYSRRSCGRHIALPSHSPGRLETPQTLC